MGKESIKENTWIMKEILWTICDQEKAKQPLKINALMMGTGRMTIQMDRESTRVRIKHNKEHLLMVI